MTTKYRCVLADPPWGFKNWSEAGELKNANQHYPCMTVEQIAALPVRGVIADDAALFLWVTGPFLMRAAEVATAWGFPYYSCLAFTWAKQSSSGEKWHFSTGYWTRHNAEVVLMFTRKKKPERLARNVAELIVAPVREHSRKPDETHERIEALLAGPRLELFSRRAREGWTCLGNEITENSLDVDLRALASQPRLELP